MNAARRLGVVAFVAILLAQAAWMLAVPPFRGSDEFDHAFRAAGILNGDWHPTTLATDGRGWLVEVPGSLVEAARGQCESLPYTKPQNCTPVTGEDAQGNVTIATAAGNYNPAFYAVLGVAGAPFEGSGALYAMRIVSAVLCALFVAASASLIVGVAGRWTWLGFLAGATPVLIYSTVVAAPNGLEMAAGLCLWSALLALERPQADLRSVVAAGVLSSVVLLNVRLLGPAWMVLIVLTAVLFVGTTRLRALVRQYRRGAAAVVALLAVSAVPGLGWTLLSLVSGGSADGEPAGDDVPSWSAAIKLHLWVLQLIAAFPYRDQPAPLVVYVLVFFVIAVYCWLGIRLASGTKRVVLLASMAVVLLVPVLLTATTMSSQGAIWQGRYALPFAVGVPILCGLVLDRAGWRLADQHVLVPMGVTMLALAHAVSVTHVLAQEKGRPVSQLDGSWWQPGWVGLPAVLMSVAWLSLLLVVMRHGRTPDTPAMSDSPALTRDSVP